MNIALSGQVHEQTVNATLIVSLEDEHSPKCQVLPVPGALEAVWDDRETTAGELDHRLVTTSLSGVSWSVSMLYVMSSSGLRYSPNVFSEMIELILKGLHTAEMLWETVSRSRRIESCHLASPHP